MSAGGYWKARTRTMGGRSMLLMLGLIGWLSGCTHQQTITFTPTIRPAASWNLQRLLVFIHAGDDGKWYLGAKEGLQRALSKCDVVSMVFLAGPLQVSPIQHATQLADSIQAEAIVSILGKGATATQKKFQTDRSLVFDLWLVDRASTQVMWRANASLSLFTDLEMEDQSSGKKFGEAIIEQLRKDKVLPRCPRPTKSRRKS